MQELSLLSLILAVLQDRLVLVWCQHLALIAYTLLIQGNAGELAKRSFLMNTIDIKADIRSFVRHIDLVVFQYRIKIHPYHLADIISYKTKQSNQFKVIEI